MGWNRLDNLPQTATGNFPIAIELDTRAPARTIGRVLEAAAETLVNSDSLGNVAPEGGEARLLLDSLDSTLRSETVMATALADELAAERAAPLSTAPEDSLQALLDRNREGALSVVQELAALTTADIQSLRLYATVGIDDRDTLELPLRFRAQRVEALAAGASTVRAALDLSDREQAVTEATRSEGDDTIALSSARLELPFGALSAQVLRAVVSFGAAGHGSEIRQGVGCASLGTWLSEQGYAQAARCDEDCVQMACDRAVARLTSAAETALIALSESRPTFSLTGDFVLGDDDGDLDAETLSSEGLTGEWEPAEGDLRGDAVSGTAATVSEPAPPEP